MESLLAECLEVFGELGGLEIRVCYKPLRRGVLGQTRIKKQVSILHGKRRFVWAPIIEVSSSLRDLGDAERTRLLRYVLVHELVHISRSHLNRPRGDTHERDFESEVLARLRLIEARTNRQK